MGYTVHGILQARILEWVAFPFPSPVDLPDPGIELGSPALQWILHQLSYQGIQASICLSIVLSFFFLKEGVGMGMGRQQRLVQLNLRTR